MVTLKAWGSGKHDDAFNRDRTNAQYEIGLAHKCARLAVLVLRRAQRYPSSEMIVSHLVLKNWRNFKRVDVELGERVFIAGPNASGKSNFLDAFRFLRDVAKTGGGLQTAVDNRGGVSKIRCLVAREKPFITLSVSLAENPGENPIWRYELEFKQEAHGKKRTLINVERAWRGEELLLDRPDEEDKRDDARLTQTSLEQINSNRDFREVAEFLAETLYLHLVPQLVRYPDAFSGPGIPGDPFGASFLDRVSRTPARTRQSRLAKIETALRVAVPQLQALTHTTERGVPHLEATYEHWRAKGAKQREDQFSDGTLRLIGLLWALLERDSLLLLEEPELSVSNDIERRLPGLMFRVMRKKKRQVLITTHSLELLSDQGIAGEEVLLLTPSSEATSVKVAAAIPEVRGLLNAGLPIGEAVLPRTAPKNLEQLTLSS